MTKDRNLTDADTEALAIALEARLVKRFYLNLGKGVWSLAWKAAITIIVGLALYGSVKGHFS